MKKKVLFFTISFLLVISSSKSQNRNDYGTVEKMPAFYLGLGAGLNNNCGLAGFKLGIRLNEKMILDAGVGVGTWGTKVGLGIVFNAINKNAWCPVLSISRASGMTNFENKLEVIDQFDVKSEKTIKMNLNAATMFNIGVQHQWVRKSGNRMVLDLGFSILIDGGSYEMLDYTNRLTDESKVKVNAFKPGGLTVGFSYNIGVN